MVGAPFWILFTLIALYVAGVALAFMLKGVKRRQVSPLLGLAFACIVASLVFTDGLVLPYSLLGAGVVFAAVDVVLKKRKDKRLAAAGAASGE